MELIFTPEAYGAATDGISDDTRAVQSAMDAAAGAGGRCLLAGGIYLLVQPDRPSSGNYWPDWSRASCADLRNIQGLRTCIHKRLTPPGRIFSRHTALIFLEIHPVFLRKIALSGGKSSRPSGVPRL